MAPYKNQFDPNTGDKLLSQALHEAGQEPVKNANSSGQVTLSTGVVLKAKSVPLYIFRKVKARFDSQKPRVPEVYNAQSDRMIEHAEHPDYLADIEAWEQASEEKMLDAMIAMGTEIVSVPEGFSIPGDEEWVSGVEFIIGETVGDAPLPRYAAWVKYVAIHSPEDIEAITEIVYEKIGVTAEDVNQQLATFPRN